MLYSPASAKCLMKYLVLDFLVLFKKRAINTAPLPSTMLKNNIQRTVNWTVYNNVNQIRATYKAISYDKIVYSKNVNGFY